MTTRVVTGSATGSPNEVAANIVSQLDAASLRPQLLLVFASVRCPLPTLAPLLAHAFESCLLLGASSAGEFTQDSECSGCVAFFALDGDFLLHGGFAAGLSHDCPATVARAIAQLPSPCSSHPHRTALVLLDTLSGHGEESALLLAAHLGEDVVLAGGAAADEGMQQTFVALGAQVAQDAIALVLIDSLQPLGIGVAHGHRPMSAALRVTKAHDNVVSTIDGKPAWRVWVEHTRSAALALGLDPLKLSSAEQFMHYLVLFEAGLSIGRDFKVRAPLSRGQDDSLRFACGIPEGAVIRIMQSQAEAQLASARHAAEAAKRQVPGKIAGALAFDCVCRKLILKDDFVLAVRAIAEVLDAPLAGFETFGEIALSVGEMSGFHNTTTVVVAFPE